ncbi:hypothetical protein Dgeo_0161 [Deinococcus geothermalis DSM 11300]|uniref:Uncharacterized protein n=1 Tax=Deinococcus geothermalis (strain DSM 11300 / CIP 105573 / AG-3a) TaxID=319795 RepID=Q1J220_DEIGD|nr:hypothetical protein Dgeo_0161 [Deinococcus geothermalis DSM 11300]
MFPHLFQSLLLGLAAVLIEEGLDFAEARPLAVHGQDGAGGQQVEHMGEQRESKRPERSHSGLPCGFWSGHCWDPPNLSSGLEFRRCQEAPY